MSKTGTLYIISAPSGAGKSTLINAFLQNQPLYEAQFSVSHTTRQPRNAEQHGVHYYFVEKAEFEKMIQNGDLLEHAEVFGNFYGTSRKLIEDTLATGVDVFLDIDWQGARQIRAKMPDARSIYILPPSRNELLRRLKGRSQDSYEVIANRMAKALSEIEHYDEYDYVIVNDDFEQALTDFKTIMRAERLTLNRQQARNGQLISKLLHAE